MFEQYARIKAECPDALLFYRMGDFYELFFEDAVIASRELQIALTSRNKNAENAIPMCGVPWHSSKSYLAQLIDKGYKVAICEQTEDAKAAKGLVKRAITRVITPGTVLDDNSLDAGSHNYLGAIFVEKTGEACAFAWADLSTGQWSGAEFRRHEDLWQWVQKMAPKELLLPEDLKIPAHCALSKVYLVRTPLNDFDLRRATERVLRVQHVQEAAALGLQKQDKLMRACGVLVAYLEQTQKCDIHQLAPFVPLNLNRRMLVDETTERNLEIFTTLNGRKGKGTLRHVVDSTVTPMGARLLEDMLHHPWRELQTIRHIQDAVAFFHDHDQQRQKLREALGCIHDLERISSRIALNRCVPRDFIALRNTLAALPAVRESISSAEGSRFLTQILTAWDDLSDCTDLLTRSLVDNPPLLLTDGGLFRTGYNAELDHLLDMVNNGEAKMQTLLEQEKNKTGLVKLKLGYNRIFGHYYELPRSALPKKLPAHFLPRQSLANAERFVTAELKELEEALLSASEKQKTFEYELFQQLREHFAKQHERFAHSSELLAQLDYWQCLAEVGRRNVWVRPVLLNEPFLEILDGRHPVVEEMTGRTNFVPNSFQLEPGHSFCLLTGPNMAGKSTILRQVALICLLAQMGAMVPASSATLGLVDRLFSRVGASDNLAQGESTFMVEMMETARILRQATPHSLVILDEIGRGTSTFDGVALAWSVVEYLTKKAEGVMRVFFATHYHELTELEGRIPSLFTMNVAIREYQDKIIFLHRALPGPSDRSYGIEVARLAGVPAPVVQRAKTILSNLEQSRKDVQKTVTSLAMTLPGLNPKNVPTQEQKEVQTTESCEHPLLSRLRTLQTDTLSPLEALHLLTEWKKQWGQK